MGYCDTEQSLFRKYRDLFCCCSISRMCFAISFIARRLSWQDFPTSNFFVAYFQQEEGNEESIIFRVLPDEVVPY